jgi:hypothetical protein
LKDFCQVRVGQTEYAVFNFQDILAFEQGIYNCPRAQAFKTSRLARQEHKDDQLRNKPDDWQVQRNPRVGGQGVGLEYHAEGEDEAHEL